MEFNASLGEPRAKIRRIAIPSGRKEGQMMAVSYVICVHAKGRGGGGQEAGAMRVIGFLREAAFFSTSSPARASGDFSSFR